MFEDLHGFQDVGEFSAHLKKLASANHGLAGREFVRRMSKKHADDPQEQLDFLNAREKAYKTKAKARITSSGDLTRIHDKFSTVYAAGSLAIREGILPFEGKDLLDAILTCEEDHVRFVEDELAGIAQSQLPPIECLRAYAKKTTPHLLISRSKRSPITTTIKPVLVI
jgi:hypothetical protein